MNPETSFAIFGTLTLSWEFFRRHTGRGMPVVDWESDGLLVRTPSHQTFSLLPWLYLIPEKYQEDTVRYFETWDALLPEECWEEPNEEKFKFEAYRGFIGLIQKKMIERKWPLGGV